MMIPWISRAQGAKKCVSCGMCMACPGGCMDGAGTNVPYEKSSKALNKFVDSSTKKIPDKESEDTELN